MPQANVKELKEMLKNAVHFGHATSKWNPKMKKYIYGEKQGIHVFDLEKTQACLEKALDFLSKSVKEGKTVMFISTKQQVTDLVKEAAKDCGVPYVTQKWVPGLLTNFRTIKQRIRYLKKLKDEETTGEFSKYTKKEASELKKTINKLEISLGGVQDLMKPPDIVIILDVYRDEIAVKEASRTGVKIIGLADSNANPSLIDYPIPANDDAIKSLTYMVNKFKDTIKAGKK
ncbi:MAG: 30S ribosomal protein S2 [uncultured bacterium]|nr:MAG: 30S ribosomal protein S2 [uncultured bacterium]KKT02853.1 MAG: 30S ribosomal protein S2, small subunit ribosomal protein S2 [Candidatus Peregrinibacteria bacterium GW2011_GWF2_43_17]KKT19994.1 MAG: 30S ribosomal protein S2 [Candidatus Peregrinibacteria bacterium GW2011_GWA2_43_8]HAU39638.1 30S ribosomal protein S2 [Candidatus Peregrinibacteria bacterium]